MVIAITRLRILRIISIRNILGIWLGVVRREGFRIRDGVVNRRVLGRDLMRLDRDAYLDGFIMVLRERGVRDGVLRILGMNLVCRRRKVGIFVLHGCDDDVEVFFVLIWRLEEVGVGS